MKHISLKAGKIALLVTVALVSTGAQPRLGALDDRLLASHNRERELMGVPELRWNDELARGAQAWADHLSATGRFEHSPNVPGKPLEGENIWGGTPGAFRPEDMIGLWLKEKTYFTPGTFPLNSTTGRAEDVSHYTQLIWSRSGEVGCGVSDIGREEILVCRYSEPGNVRGRDPLAPSNAAPAPRLRRDYSPFRRPVRIGGERRYCRRRRHALACIPERRACIFVGKKARRFQYGAGIRRGSVCGEAGFANCLDLRLVDERLLLAHRLSEGGAAAPAAGPSIENMMIELRYLGERARPIGHDIIGMIMRRHADAWLDGTR